MIFEFPPASGRSAEYSEEERELLRMLLHSDSALDNDAAQIFHDLKVDLDAKLVTGQRNGDTTHVPLSVPLRGGEQLDLGLVRRENEHADRPVAEQDDEQRVVEHMLSSEEAVLAGSIAKARNRYSTAKGDAPAHGAPRNDPNSDAPLEVNVIGAKGEVAVARLLDLFPNLSVYHQEKQTGGYDLPHKISVRSAQKRFGLLVRSQDPDDARCIAAVVVENQVLILGWMEAGAAKQEQWLRAPHGRPPCYLVPEKLLLPLSKLAAIIAIERLKSVANLG